jgi:mono/diheme cytochrome c family protein
MPVRSLLCPALMALMAAVLSGCEEKTYDPPGEASRLELADSLYSPTLFDTITWASEEQRVNAGNLVYADSCRRCHGTVGEGGTTRVAGTQLDVPSLVAADWRFHEDLPAVRERVFTGHTGGMPSWGISRLTPRQIDAVAYYIVQQLRPELLNAPDTRAPAR